MAILSEYSFIKVKRGMDNPITTPPPIKPAPDYANADEDVVITKVCLPFIGTLANIRYGERLGQTNVQ